MPITEQELLTVAQWRAAALAGHDVLDLVAQRHARIAEAPAPGVWITLAAADLVEQRLTSLRQSATGLSADERSQRWPLFGVPFAVKDNIDAQGWPTTAACPAWAHTAAEDATVVRRLLDAGAVLIGKTNLDQFATGLVGTRSPYGIPSSALVPGHVSGGSSSGSAVAVARGDVAFSLGTDTAGSGRIPAGFNNIVGLKPTPGRVSTAGVLPACRSLDCVSVLSLTVQDAATVLAVLEGPDPDDDYSQFRPGLAAFAEQPRVGLPAQLNLSTEQGYDAAWPAAVANLTALGAAATALDFAPLDAVAHQLYEGAWVAERYIVVRDLLDREPTALDPAVASVIGRAKGLSAARAFEGLYALRRGQQWAQGLWQQVDFLMVPTAPRHPSLADLVAQPIEANALMGTYTNFVNLLGWSALALPAGFTPQGFPFGVTLIGPAGADAALARFGVKWQRSLGLTLGATGRAQEAAPAAAAEPVLWPVSEAQVEIAVVGAHLSGMPLNAQLTERSATLVASTHTASQYLLYALPGHSPPKPGLVRVGAGSPAGHSIAVEVWSMPAKHVGSFLALIPPPLGLGTLELADGRLVKGFVCEAYAVAGAQNISEYGGWRAWTQRPRKA